jgi:hypothetical protein
MTAPNRRWFRFTLRTLFVTVTLACALSGWLVWNLRQMRHRVETAKRIESRGGSVEWGWIYDSDLKSVPSLWRLIGAEPMFLVGLPCEIFTKDEAKAVRETFPEALVYRVEPGWDATDDEGE